MDWYPWHYKQFKSATRHLTAEQDGIYRRLIDEYMETREPLPDNDIALARIAGVNKNKWLDASSIVKAFFKHKSGLLFHDFCDTQLDIQDKKSKRRSEIAEKAAKKRWKKNELKQEDECIEHSSSNSEAMLPDATETGTEREIKKKEDSPHSLTQDGIILKQALDAYQEIAQKNGLPLVQMFSAERKSKLRLRLSECGGLSGWMQAMDKLKNSSFCLGETGWKANFDFIIQKTSFTKLMEGNYDDTERKTQSEKNKQSAYEWATTPPVEH